MTRTKTLKSMSADEARSERRRHRHETGVLVLELMSNGLTDFERSTKSTRLLKLRRRIVRLDRRILAASRPTFPTTPDDAVIQPINWGGV